MITNYSDIHPMKSQDAGYRGSLELNLGNMTYRYRRSYSSAFKRLKPFYGDKLRVGGGKIELEGNTITLLKTELNVTVHVKGKKENEVVIERKIENFGPLKFTMKEGGDDEEVKGSLVGVESNEEEWWKSRYPF